MRLLVVSAIGVVLFGILAKPLILNQVPIEYDLGRYHLPLRDFYQKCLHNGDDPAWCPHLFCGYDLHGEGQVGMDHPWHWFLYSFLPLTIAFNIEIYANYPLLCLGTYIFLRRHQLPRDAAMAGALTATFGGFTLPHYSHTNAIAIVAHLPWLLWFADILRNDESPTRKAWTGAGIAILTGSQILLGYPQYVYFSCLAEGIYVLCLGRLISIRLLQWLLFKAIGVAIGGAQLLPSLQALSLSPRMGYDAEFRGMLSLPWEMLPQLVAPTHFNVGAQLHEYTVYCGALATLGTVCWLCNGSWLTSKNVIDRFAFWLILVAVPLALGRHTPLFQFYLKLPIVGVFRCPCRYLVLSHFAAAIIVARLVQQLSTGTIWPWRWIILILIVPALSWIAFAIPWEQHFSDESIRFIALGAGYHGAINISVAALLIVAAARGYRWAVPLILIVGYADLGLWSFRPVFGTADTPVHTFVDLATFNASQVRPPGAPNGRVQIADIHGNAPMMSGWSLTSGYVGLSPSRSLIYDSVNALELAGTTWRYHDDQWQPIAGLPRFHWGDRTNDGIQLLIDRPGHIELKTNINAVRTLIVTESFHPGWRATIDGQPVEVAHADIDFQSCVVPPGEHGVKFQFESRHRRVGRALSVAGLICAFAWAIWIATHQRSTMMKVIP